MTAVSSTGAPPGDGAPRHTPTRPMPVAPPPPVVPTRRRPLLVALGVLLVALGALATWWLLDRAGDRVSVLAVVREVPYGAVVTEGDLAVTAVSVDPSVPIVPASERDSVVGAIAATRLLPGSLLSPASVMAVAPPSAGEVLVGVAVGSSRMPATGLREGDRIAVVGIPPQGDDIDRSAISAIDATVVRVGDADLDGVVVVDVAVVPGDGPALAAWSASGRVAIVVRSRGEP